jgi:hypothetical protein
LPAQQAGDPPPTRASLGQDKLYFTYRRIAGGVSDGFGYEAGGLRYIIELSDDLDRWVPASGDAALSGNPQPLEAGIEEATYELPQFPGAGGRFARIRVIRRHSLP